MAQQEEFLRTGIDFAGFSFADSESHGGNAGQGSGSKYDLPFHHVRRLASRQIPGGVNSILDKCICNCMHCLKGSQTRLYSVLSCQCTPWHWLLHRNNCTYPYNHYYRFTQSSPRHSVWVFSVNMNIRIMSISSALSCFTENNKQRIVVESISPR